MSPSTSSLLWLRPEDYGYALPGAIIGYRACFFFYFFGGVGEGKCVMHIELVLSFARD